MALTAQLASIMTGDGRNMDTVRRIHVDYADCLPVINGPFRH
jgi:hypothetical protein